MDNFYTYALYDQSEIFAPFYIGKGCGKRMYVHEQKARLGKLRNRHLQNKILQILNAGHSIGYDKFVENVDEPTALVAEQKVIKNLKNLGVKLCNLTDGGEGVSGMKHSDATKEKISEWNKTYWSPQERKRMSDAMKGTKSHLGYPQSEEAKEKISKGNKGKHFVHHSEETKRKIALAHIGKRFHHTDEAKRKIGLASKNISDETRNKIRESVRKSWLLRKQKSEVTNG